MNFILKDETRFLRVGIIMLLLMLFMAACGGDEDVVPTAVPAAEMPEGGVDAQIQLPAEETAVAQPEIIEAEPGELAPLPRLENVAGQTMGGGAGTAESTAGLTEDAFAEMALSMMVTDPFSDTTFTISTELPGEPNEASVLRYNQNETINAEQARALAARFGFNGELYLESFPDVGDTELGVAEFSPPTIFYAFDGSRVFSADPWSANYHDEAAEYDFANTIDYAAASQTAETFLQERGLLDFPYAIQPGFGSDVFVVRQIDGRVTNQPEIVVGIGEDGQVSYVSYQVMQNLENLGNYPLIPAADAWATLQAGVTENNIPYVIMPAAGQLDPLAESLSSGDFQSWQREYQPGELVQLYGWPNVYLPASGSGAARVHLFPFALNGEEETINQIADAIGQQVTVEGVVSDDGRALIVNNWTLAQEQEPITSQGSLRRDGERVLFETQDGQTYILPNVPADVPDGLQAFIFAWTSQQTGDAFPILQWESIDKYVDPVAGEGPIAEPLPVEPAFEPFTYENVTINEVMLAYYVTYHYSDQVDENSGLAIQSTILLQPVWKFIGTADNGETIEFFVQAVADEFVE